MEHVLILTVCKHANISIFYSTLCRRGEGVSKKSTLCTLAKRQKIVDHPLMEILLSVVSITLSKCFSMQSDIRPSASVKATAH